MRTVRCSGRPGGGVSARECLPARQGVYQWGVCLPGVGICLGVSAQGECLPQCILGYLPWGVSAPVHTGIPARRCLPSAFWDTHSPCGQNSWYICENITFSQLLLRKVKISVVFETQHYDLYQENIKQSHFFDTRSGFMLCKPNVAVMFPGLVLQCLWRKSTLDCIIKRRLLIFFGSTFGRKLHPNNARSSVKSCFSKWEKPQ